MRISEARYRSSDRSGNNHLYYLYRLLFKGISKTGIPVLLTPYLSHVYCIITCFIYLPISANYLFYVGVGIGC